MLSIWVTLSVPLPPMGGAPAATAFPTPTTTRCATSTLVTLPPSTTRSWATPVTMTTSTTRRSPPSRTSSMNSTPSGRTRSLARRYPSGSRVMRSTPPRRRTSPSSSSRGTAPSRCFSPYIRSAVTRLTLHPCVRVKPFYIFKRERKSLLVESSLKNNHSSGVHHIIPSLRLSIASRTSKEMY